MASVGEEELVQMVSDFIESEATPAVISPLPVPQTPQSSLQDILLKATDVETQVLEKVLMYVRNMGEPSNLKKWVVRRLEMDGFEASLCNSSWVSTFGPRVFHFAGDYEYIDVIIMEKNSGRQTRLIVDMDFRSQFELVRPTQTYKELTNTLPTIFVGTEDRLSKIICVLCSAAKQSLKEKGLHIPPWRKAKYMRSKWLSKNCKKVSVMPNTELSEDQTAEEGGGMTCCPSIF